jgi:hypothetical protein
VPRPVRFSLFALVALVPASPLAAQGEYSPITADEVVKMKFIHYYPDKKFREADFEWSFTKTEFVVKKGKGPIPADLLGQLLPDGKAADEVRGKWAFDPKRGRRGGQEGSDCRALQDRPDHHPHRRDAVRVQPAEVTTAES